MERLDIAGEGGDQEVTIHPDNSGPSGNESQGLIQSLPDWGSAQTIEGRDDSELRLYP